MFASFYGAYYYTMLAPHSMYMVACSGLSIFFTAGFLNYNMTMTLCVADAQLRSDGENVRIILYDGRTYDVPVKAIRWTKRTKDRILVDTIDEKGKPRKFLFDFSKARPQQLIDKELCMAVMHPDVHKIVWAD